MITRYLFVITLFAVIGAGSQLRAETANAEQPPPIIIKPETLVVEPAAPEEDQNIQPAFNNALSIELAQVKIGVSMGFAGSYVRVFGDRRDPDTDVIITIEGPKKDVTIWKKERIMGAWVNRYSMRVKDVPAYYQYALSAPLTKTSIEGIVTERNIETAAYISNLDAEISAEQQKEKFVKSLINQKIEQELFFTEPENFTFLNDHFFKVHFRIPPSALTGEYVIKSFLIKDGKIVQRDEDTLVIEQIGANAFINNAAKEYSLIYALICIAFAMFSGWLISVIKVKP